MSPAHTLARQVHAAPIGSLVVVLLLAAMIASSVPASAATAKVVARGKAASGAVALTFDDGWNEAACARIGSTLRSLGAKGTFFVNGNHLKAAPSTWRRILRGHAVANHTRSHRDLTRETSRVVRKQLRENERLHEKILGRPMLKLFRPPYGAHDRRVRRIAGELGYRNTVLWSVDTHDWQASATVASVVRRATGAPPGSIILMHCARNVTAAALPAIVRHYEARGIKLAGLKEVLGPGDKPRVSANRATRGNVASKRAIDRQAKPSRADQAAGGPTADAQSAARTAVTPNESVVATDQSAVYTGVVTAPLGSGPESLDTLVGLCLTLRSPLPEPLAIGLADGQSCDIASIADSLEEVGD